MLLEKEMWNHNWEWLSRETLALFEMFSILRNNLCNFKNVLWLKVQR